MADPKKKVNPIAELRAMDDNALAQKIAELQKELVEQHRANKANELPSAAVIKKTRRTIAIARTLLKERTIAVAAQAMPANDQLEAQKEQEK